uniref:Uncharacterized protein n=1 Tax=Anopheles quadriannulatus TaxID=34691 RepID=A0A182XQA5_ANOQN
MGLKYNSRSLKFQHTAPKRVATHVHNHYCTLGHNVCSFT